jgi:hypothetical protein
LVQFDQCNKREGQYFKKGFHLFVAIVFVASLKFYSLLP